MDRRRAITALAALAALSHRHESSAQAKLKRIGFHSAGTMQGVPGGMDAFRQGMSALGLLEGRDYFIDARYSDNRPDAIERNAADLVATKPDVLLATGDTSTRSLSRQTKSIPIVFVISTDPIGSGFAASIYRPGGNITGLTSMAADLAAKRLQMLREVSPRVESVGLLFNPASSQGPPQATAYENAAAQAKVRLLRLEVRKSHEIEAAIARAAELRADVVAIAQDPLLNANAQIIGEALARRKLPAIAPVSRFVDDGVLMSYAPDIANSFRQAAVYVQRILKGAKPGDLPIEQPSKFELAINLRTAKLIGVTIPQPILVRADRVVQ